MKKENEIEKGKHNIGDEKVYQGVTYYVSGFNAKGQPKWRKKDVEKKTAAPKPAPEKKEEKKTEEPAKTEPAQQTPPPAKKTQAASGTKPYNAPKPKVVYKNRPEIEYQVPETWGSRDKNGKPIDVHRDVWRDWFANPKKYPDAKLIDFINMKSNPQPNLRHLAWEEAQARGIPEDKIDVSGTLQNRWETHSEKYKMLHPETTADDEEDFGAEYSTALGNFDLDSFREKFTDGDMGWANPNDPRVKKAFNNFSSLTDRQQYDAAVDILKREDPYYEGVDDQIRSLSIALDNFITTDYKDGSAMFISTGGAGAGKTTALLRVIKANELHLYDPEEDGAKGKQPTDADIDIVEVDQDVDSEKDFFHILDKYNGKVIVFDDKDKMLVSDANKIKSAMKNLADGNYKKRILPGGKLFTGKIIFITNKSLDTLNSDEDHKAILSRADKNDIHFTLNENLEVLGKRYKTMGGKLPGFSKQEEADLRQKVYDTILANVDKIDPTKFTVRKFNEMLREVAAVKNAEKKAAKNADFEELFGGKGSNAQNWKNQIIKMLNKGEETDIEKATSHSVLSKLSPAAIVKFKEKYKKNPKEFEDLYGHWLVEFITSDEAEEKVEKAFIDHLGDSMSLEEAENLLLK